MQGTLSFLSLLIVLASLTLIPVPTEAAIYSWRDANGVVTYSNSPPALAGTAQVSVRATEAVDPGPFDPVSADTTLVDADQPQPPERAPYVATEGDFILQLVRELGLGDPSDARQAADVLTNLRIAPPLGTWQFDEPMTPELTIRLRQLSVAAADRGDIDISPEQALLAFDTAAALLNVDIPAAADQQSIPDDAYPIADLPPLVDMYQPSPDFSPYYVWTPVYGGFWWGYNFFPGYWVLNVGLFCDHYDNHYYGHGHYGGHDHRSYDHGYRGGARFASIDPSHISHHMNGHIQDHQLRGHSPAGRTVSSPGQPRSPFAAMPSRHTGLYSPRPVAPDRASYARPLSTARTPFRSSSYYSPSLRARSFHGSTYVAPSSRASSFRGTYLSPRSTGRSALMSQSMRRFGGSGVASSRPSFHGGMGGTRSSGFSSGGGRFSGGRAHSSGRGVSSAGSSSHR
ncbi:MAG TPA: DUF4124 domain-containing protein [Nitrospiria bacterium]|nr:DUF4124 domain-containing protein [Nitrospiria bacterium]